MDFVVGHFSILSIIIADNTSVGLTMFQLYNALNRRCRYFVFFAELNFIVMPKQLNCHIYKNSQYNKVSN